MKTLISVLIAGALSTTSIFAATAPASESVAGNDNAIATPKLPFRLFHKRPTGTRQSAERESRVNVGSPQLPFRLYQKQPTAAQVNKTNTLRASAPVGN